jgi:hypothetical protein
MPDEQTVEIVEVRQPDKLSLFQQEKALIDVQVATAKQYPRNVRRCVENAVTVATLTKEIAESCTYTVPRSKKSIVGPSVHLAKIIAQSWGNLRVSNKVVDIDLKHVTSQAICWDLESNIAIQTEVKRLIIGKEGRFSDDMITVTGNAANSISLRNAIFAVIPKGVTDRVYDAAKKKIVGNLSNKDQFIARRKEIFDAFRDVYGVTEEEVLRAIGKNAIDNIQKDEELVALVGIASALRDGDTTPDEAFRNKKVQIKSVDSSKLDRIIGLIMNCKSTNELERHKGLVTGSTVLSKLYDEKYSELLTRS